ncbi:MAG: hypothetical protein ACXAC7_16000 [Candidatus Hodarchaeales archaeon]|jgi:hypothetical protein
MTVIYKQYEPEKGFEEKQAFIYNKAIEPYGGTPVTAESISKRLEQELQSSEKPDYEGIRFALKEDDTPLAYIQYKCYPGTDEVYIGYPWATDDSETTLEVQEKLYSELFEYIQKKYPDRPIVMGYINDNFTKIHEFAKAKGFIEKNRFGRYKFEINKLKEFEYQEFKSKVCTLDDLDKIVELGKADTAIMNSFPDEDQLINYFKDRVIPEGHTIVIMDDTGQFIAAGAPLTGNIPDATLIRFAAVRPGFENAFKTMVAKLAEHCEQHKMGNDPLAIFASHTSRTFMIDYIKEINATKISESVLHELKSEK